ncbi:MAG: tRNA (adenosine(37)-N6)-dimethylallyltransferase MiaA [Sedimentisphaerales bacterium]|nr:tRNA (adenosine(37)-N6)-dimethylallyltransferase MiaA [Sedimentisphaerales bacterium]
MAKNRLLILGVTASGKGRLAFELAKKIDAEIISIDSMKVYRRMDIGTAKPSKEAQKQINYHLLDVAEPSESFSVDRFLSLADTAVKEIESKGKPVIAVGGSAMYIKALLYGIFEGPGTNEQIRKQLKERIKQTSLEELHKQLAAVDPDAAERIHLNDEKRIIRALEVYELTGKPISSFQQQFDLPAPKGNWKIIGLRREKSEESRRINARVKKMIEEGLVDEVKSLLAEEKPMSDQAKSAIGYAEIINHLQGKETLEKAIESIKINTRRFAKSQRTWFKTFKNVNWFDLANDETPESILAKAKALIVDK